MSVEIRRIGVIGAGQMGSGIAQVAAQKGLSVVLCDATEELAKKGHAKLGATLDKLVAKEKLTREQREQAMGRITPAGALAALADCDLVVEAATEDETLKKKLFRELDGICKKEALLASNTSSISITRLAAATSRPEQVIGMHFMNPVPVMQLVEVIRGLQTSDATYNATCALAVAMGKTVVTSKDGPGFIVNRILIPMLNEAAFALGEGMGTAEDIDKAMKLGTNQPMGPLELADFIGLDTVLAICEVLWKNLGEDKYRPAPLLRQHVDAGWLGRKTGRGFHRY
jgi:3-hydroxybutyryl-CoA dehydrogenase